jgi:hypothetical protein
MFKYYLDELRPQRINLQYHNVHAKFRENYANKKTNNRRIDGHTYTYRPANEAAR